MTERGRLAAAMTALDTFYNESVVPDKEARW